MGDRFKRFLSKLFVDNYNCIVCDRELHNPNKYGICHICMSNLPFNDGHICAHCGRQMKDEAMYCLSCQNNTFHFDACRSSMVYKDDAKLLLHRLKYDSRKYIIKYLVQFYVDLYKKSNYDDDIIVSVPMSAERKRSRGFNQAEEIGKELSQQIGLPFVENVVVKIKNLRPQEEFGGRERMQNVLGAFKLANGDKIKDKKVLLIDDVLTTGATMSAVALELKRKCKRVDCLVFASPQVKYREVKGDVLIDYAYEIEKD